MGAVIRRALAHVAPEELLLIPVVIIVALAILAQPTSITRLFETPYATPIPGDSPADLILGDRARTPAPAPSPVTVELFQREGTPVRQIVIPGQVAPRVLSGPCPEGTLTRELASSPGSRVLTACIIVHQVPAGR